MDTETPTTTEDALSRCSDSLSASQFQKVISRREASSMKIVELIALCLPLGTIPLFLTYRLDIIFKHLKFSSKSWHSLFSSEWSSVDCWRLFSTGTLRFFCPSWVGPICPFVLVEDSHLLNVSALLQPIIVALILKMLFFDEDLESQLLSTGFCVLEDVLSKVYRGAIVVFCEISVIFR